MQQDDTQAEDARLLVRDAAAAACCCCYCCRGCIFFCYSCTASIVVGTGSPAVIFSFCLCLSVWYVLVYAVYLLRVCGY